MTHTILLAVGGHFPERYIASANHPSQNRDVSGAYVDIHQTLNSRPVFRAKAQRLMPVAQTAEDAPPVEGAQPISNGTSSQFVYLKCLANGDGTFCWCFSSLSNAGTGTLYAKGPVFSSGHMAPDLGAVYLAEAGYSDVSLGAI